MTASAFSRAGARRRLPRHRTLLATIQWSYDNLAPEKQRFFRLLAVFAGGWSLGAAAAVAGEDNDEFVALDHLTRFVDKSLVVVERDESGEAVYRMLETVREFAQERLPSRARTTGLGGGILISILRSQSRSSRSFRARSGERGSPDSIASRRMYSRRMHIAIMPGMER